MKLLFLIGGAGLWIVAATIMLISGGLMSSPAQANVFGYDNYEECLIEEMRGLPANMIPTVSSFCRKKFPSTELSTPSAPAKKSPYSSYEDCVEGEFRAELTDLNTLQAKQTAIARATGYCSVMFP